MSTMVICSTQAEADGIARVLPYAEVVLVDDAVTVGHRPEPYVFILPSVDLKHSMAGMGGVTIGERLWDKQAALGLFLPIRLKSQHEVLTFLRDGGSWATDYKCWTPTT